MKIQIVAEIAQGFEGCADQARLLMRAAAKAGADAAKYQLVYADELATPEYKYYELFKSLEMPDEAWLDLSKYAREQNIELHLDIFGMRSLSLAESISASAIKIHGTDISNIGLLNSVAKSSIRNIFLGAGGALHSEIINALSLLKNKNVVVLLGYQGYPTEVETNQISRVNFLSNRLAGNGGGVQIGFADHAQPDTPLRYGLAATAVGAGATVIEKHITLGKIMMLEDHESALNPDEFEEFVQVVRACAEAYGEVVDNDDYGMAEAEFAYRKAIRRHVVTADQIPVDKALSPADLVLKRTAAENPLTDLSDAYGKKTLRILDANQAVLPEDLT